MGRLRFREEMQRGRKQVIRFSEMSYEDRRFLKSRLLFAIIIIVLMNGFTVIIRNIDNGASTTKTTK